MLENKKFEVTETNDITEKSQFIIVESFLSAHRL